jgi:carbamoyl-phosphate synthase large subunit
MDREITVLLTGIGCPGARGVIRALKENPDSVPVQIVGVDCRDTAAGQHFVDWFYQVPPGDDVDYIPQLLDIAIAHQVDVVFPQISGEVMALAKGQANFKCPVMVPRIASVMLCQDKAMTYDWAKENGIPVPKYHVADGRLDTLWDLGLGHRRLCYKPRYGKGSRGFGMIEPSGRNALELRQDYLVMEYVGGEETSVDALCRGGEILTGYVKRREGWRKGFAMEHEVIDRPDLMKLGRKVAGAFELDWLVNIQFKGSKLMEINSRVSTQIVTHAYNQPWLAVELATGMVTAEELGEIQHNTGKRRSVYYFDVLTY